MFENANSDTHAGFILIKYHNRRMLLTIDLQSLFTTLFDAFGDEVEVRFLAMTESERLDSAEIVDGIPAIRERFWIIEMETKDLPRRRNDLEQRCVSRGRK